jgi:hypothetical protein
MSYEGTFLMAVATAYFLALNGLAAYLFLQLARTREEMKEVRSEFAKFEPQIRQVANVANLVLEASSINLKNQKEPSS